MGDLDVRISLQGGHWARAAEILMGKHLTRVETNLILNLSDPSRIHTIGDLGAEAGRFSLLTTGKKAAVMGMGRRFL